ncbi:MAG: hypothetical protein ABSB82_03085 [Terriglobia bacterium]
MGTLGGHSEPVTSVAWSPDGKRLATGSEDHTAKVWGAESGKELLTLRGHSSRAVVSNSHSATRPPDAWPSSSACFCTSVRYSKGLAPFSSQVWIRLINRSPTPALFSVL